MHYVYPIKSFPKLLKNTIQRRKVTRFQAVKSQILSENSLNSDLNPIVDIFINKPKNAKKTITEGDISSKIIKTTDPNIIKELQPPSEEQKLIIDAVLSLKLNDTIKNESEDSDLNPILGITTKKPNKRKASAKKTIREEDINSKIIKTANSNFIEELQPASQEQKLIIDAVLSQQFNVQVNAVAGSGKTTTILHIANTIKHKSANDTSNMKSVLALVYNARLKAETKLRRDELNLNDVLEVHSFHAFVYKYYEARDARTDTGLIRIVQENTKPHIPFSFDLFVLDEAQDMTPEYYAAVCKIMRDNLQQNFSILILGDERQNIFKFKNADARFLTKSEEVFGPLSFISKPWKKLTLSTTYRLTYNVATFMNEHVLNFPLFQVAHRPNEDKVQYYRGNAFRIAEEIGDLLLELLRSGRYKESDIFILTPSVRGGRVGKETPVNILADFLQDNGFSYYRPSNDEKAINEKVIQNKIVVSTFHQTKGLERKVVIVFQFQRSYFDYYARDDPLGYCPNALYVACTRASERLILVGEDALGEELPFLNNIQDSSHLEIISVGRLKNEKRERMTADKSTQSVTQLTKFISEPTMRNAMSFIRTEELSPEVVDIKLESMVNTGRKQFEDVADLNGLAIPAIYEQMTSKGRSTIHNYCIKMFDASGDDSTVGPKYDKYRDYLVELAEMDCCETNIQGYLRLAAIYSYATSGFSNKPFQIKKYDWLTSAVVEKCIDVLDVHLRGRNRDVTYEEDIEVTDQWQNSRRQVTVVGRVDAITDDAIWELKCTDELEQEHILQLAMYAWIRLTYERKVKSTNSESLAQGTLSSRQFLLLNVRTGQLIKIVSSFEELDNVAKILIENSLMGDPKLTDAEFMKIVENKRKTILPTVT